MARYIDADKFHEWVYPNWSYCAQNDDDFHEAIDAQPTADVAPVAHAHWIETEDLSGNHYAECSNCCLLWWIDGESSQEAEMNYCPRCGAKMDEEVEDA